MFRSEEQAKFHQLVAKHIAQPDLPLLLEGGTGLGKTRAYLKALAETDKSAAIILPTHQLIDQLLVSQDLQAVGISLTTFRPSSMFESRAEYLENKSATADARVMLCTSASVMIDQRLTGDYNGVVNRDYLLFDEADQLPQAAALQRDLTITEEDLRIAGVRLDETQETLEALVTNKKVSAEVRGRSRIMLEALEEQFWFQRVGKDDMGGIQLFHHLPGRLLKRISNQQNVAFISATLSIADKLNDFQRSMGIAEISRFSGRIEPKSHGELTLTDATAYKIEDVIGLAERPCLVVTTSFDVSEEIAKLVPEAIVRERGETTTEAIQRLSKNDGVLIAVAAWAGLDTPMQWASIVIPKVPYGNPVEIDDHIESRYIDSKNIAIRRMRQVVGRGLRRPDAKCAIYVLDERYKKLGRFLPNRFVESWLEGGQATVTLSAKERDPLIRKRVLERYGVVCLSCGLKPPHPQVIDVHHLDPIAEGERMTTLEDVIPLCRNCHALAHTTKPPILLAELKKLALEQ
jgi:Rad3-related DNA helicase